MTTQSGFCGSRGGDLPQCFCSQIETCGRLLPSVVSHLYHSLNRTVNAANFNFIGGKYLWCWSPWINIGSNLLHICGYWRQKNFTLINKSFISFSFHHQQSYHRSDSKTINGVIDNLLKSTLKRTNMDMIVQGTHIWPSSQKNILSQDCDFISVWIFCIKPI